MEATGKIGGWFGTDDCILYRGQGQVKIYLFTTRLVGGAGQVITGFANYLEQDKHAHEVTIFVGSKREVWPEYLRSNVKVIGGLNNRDQADRVKKKIQAMPVPDVAFCFEGFPMFCVAKAYMGANVQLIGVLYSWSHGKYRKPRDEIQDCFGFTAANSVITASETWKKKLQAIGVGQVRVVPLGVESGVFYELGIKRKHRAFGTRLIAVQDMIGEGWDRKDTDLLLEIGAGFDGELDIYGDLPGKDLVSRTDFPNVFFHGHVSRRRIMAAYAGADGFISTSREEGFGLSILEAMAAGLPVITTDSGGNMDFVCDDYNARVIDRDAGQAIEAINMLMGAGGQETRKKLASGAFETGMSFDIDKAYREYLRIMNIAFWIR